MFSDTLTITINAQAKVLSRINQDKYSSEYLLREAASEFRMRIRHTSYTDKTRGAVIDRHNVEFSELVYPTEANPKGTARKAYTVLENENRDGSTLPVNFDLGFIAFFTNANVTKLVNWES